MLKNIGILSLLILLSLSCRKEKRVRIFEMSFPNLEFEIPAGAGGFESMFFIFPELKTNFQNFLDANGTDINTIGGIYPLNARITSFDGNEYYYINDVEVRVCFADGNFCTEEIDGVFYNEGLNGRADNIINLQTGLQNVRDLMMGEFFRLEVVMKSQITPVNGSNAVILFFPAVIINLASENHKKNVPNEKNDRRCGIAGFAG